MSNFQCPHCGMTNIDCGKDGYKTPKEIELEEKIKRIFDNDSNFCETECCAKNHCNGNCCYEQLREIFGYGQ